MNITKINNSDLGTALHSRGSCLHPKSSQTALTAQNHPLSDIVNMQNKPNLLDVRIHVILFAERRYGTFGHLVQAENKPNSNPIKPNFVLIQSELTGKVLIRKTNPILKPSVIISVLITWSYRNTELTEAWKTNPISDIPLSGDTSDGCSGGIYVDMSEGSAYNHLLECAKNTICGPFLHNTGSFARPKGSP